MSVICRESYSYSEAKTVIRYTCAGRFGSLDHEEIDAQTYASWEIDYLSSFMPRFFALVTELSSLQSMTTATTKAAVEHLKSLTTDMRT